MQARIRFHGELNDLIARERRGAETMYVFPAPGSVKDAIEALGVPHPEVGRIRVDGADVGFDRLIRDGDRVDVFPCAGAGEIGDALPCTPEGEPQFVLDVHLGTLAGYLRLLGADALYRNDFRDDELAAVAAAEGRVLLTRDLGLLKRSIVRYGRFVRATRPREQLREVAARYGLQAWARPFTRCIRCNGVLRRARREEVLPNLPPRVAEVFHAFKRCDGCGRVYWEGSHMTRMQGIVQEALRSGAEG